MGSDGCGTITSVGPDVDENLVGKNVAFFGGSWSTYVIKESKMCMHIDPKIDLYKAANAYVNPLTACNMLHYALEEPKTKGVI